MIGRLVHVLLAGSSSQVEMDSCVSYLQFPVGHSMAPLSHLLVYYVRENGEGVTDSVQIPIQSDFENQVCAIPETGCRHAADLNSKCKCSRSRRRMSIGGAIGVRNQLRVTACLCKNSTASSVSGLFVCALLLYIYVCIYPQQQRL